MFLNLEIMSPMDTWDFTLKIGAALIGGIIIGFEREYRGKSAGLKTQTLVAIGSAVFISISLMFAGEDYVDITRVLSQVVIGIGFLGGGVILEKKDRVKGLTTAATVWCSAAAGCLAGFGLFKELAILTVLVLIINSAFRLVNDKIEENDEDDDES